jgi:hypothetical protein
MASKGRVGIDIDIAKVPLRESDMEPFEIMVSESQERMLCVVEPDLLDAVEEPCAGGALVRECGEHHRHAGCACCAVGSCSVTCR